MLQRRALRILQKISGSFNDAEGLFDEYLLYQSASLKILVGSNVESLKSQSVHLTEEDVEQ